MKKIKLELDALNVESFPTESDAQTSRGTVHAHRTDGLLCISVAPCVNSDMGTCGGSCYETCAGNATCGQFTCNYTDQTGCPQKI